MTTYHFTGTFENSDLASGVLTVNIYPETAEDFLALTVSYPSFAEATKSYPCERTGDSSCNVNIGEELPAGTFTYDLVYVK